MTAAKAAPMISEMSFSVGGNISATKGTECCDPNAFECPVTYYEFGGSVGATLGITLNVPGWYWYFDREYTDVILFYAVFEVNLGPTLTVTPSGQLSALGRTSDCGGCLSIGLSGQVGVGVGFGGTVHGLVRVFEEGHWYTLDEEILFSLMATANSSVSLGGSYANGSSCEYEGLSGVTVGYGAVTATGSAAATIRGVGVSIGHSWQLLEGYSYPPAQP